MSGSETKIVTVEMGDIKVDHNDHILRSAGIGSCVVITLYDPSIRVGAMAHPILAENAGASIEHPLRFVDNAINAMVLELEKLGAKKERLEAKVVGGANMFKVFDSSLDGIGAQNAKAAKEKLEKENITIMANDTGGNIGRSVTFDLKTGLLEVKTKI
jgi:chemotaxis protein CheD